MNNQLRIAIAEDEPEIRRFFVRVLERLGHTVVGAVENGIELIDLCRSEQLDLVVTDMVMPEMDGFDTIVNISQEFSLPVIVISSYDLADSDEVNRLGNIVAYLMKPVSEQQLAAAIDNWTTDVKSSDKSLSAKQSKSIVQ
ncbi:MAG: response regulator [Aeoliella sp.]